MRKLILLLTAGVCCFLLNAQCLLPAGVPDTLFPVTNTNSVLDTSYPNYVNDFDHYSGATIFNVIKNKGAYYLFGDFTNLSRNQGSALVIDSSTNNVFTTQKWRINGKVTEAIDDGSGGFYICGTFTKIGDSSRKYLAQIDGLGRPTAWNPKADDFVKAIYRKNDTLFIAGAFSSIFGKQRKQMALYSIPGDSLCKPSFPTSPVSNNISNIINTFLIQKDTLIMGGSYQIRKYNFKDSVLLPWVPVEGVDGEVLQMQFNKDSTSLVYLAGSQITTINTQSGAQKFQIDVRVNTDLTISPSMNIDGNKGYVVGRFKRISNGTIYERQAFFAFDVLTGAILPDDLKCDGELTFIYRKNGKLFLSGNFAKINGVNRENFAVVDTGSLKVGSWQLTPTDPLTSLAFSNNKTFIGGYFVGINSIHRNGFAAIDSATKTILPWAPHSKGFVESKKMLLRGDTLIILGITARPYDCMQYTNFFSAIQLVSISTGATITCPPLGFSKINDILLDGNYLYVAADNQVRRFVLPGITKDPTWGMDFTSYGSEHSPMYLIMTADKLYSVGDNRFTEPCTTLPLRKGWLIAYDKTTGLPTTFYSYQGASPYYDVITFEHALLLNNKLYVQGQFNTLNGKSRKNFVALDINSGQITDWRTPFSDNGTEKSFQRTTDLKLYNGKIWFGASGEQSDQPPSFQGFGAIDTTTGELMPLIFSCDENRERLGKTRSIHDFLFDGNTFIGVGDFDSVNARPYASIIKTPLVAGPTSVVKGSSIAGPDTIYVGTTKQYYVVNGDSKANAYHWTYPDDGLVIEANGSDTIVVRADSVSTGQLTVQSQAYCDASVLLKKNIVVAAAQTPPLPKIINVSDKCQTANSSFGKLVNPPPGQTISITRDGSSLTYNAADSSFKYFENGITSVGQHKITVKYTNSFGSNTKDSNFYVIAALTPGVDLSADVTTVTDMGHATLTATNVISGGLAPLFTFGKDKDMTASLLLQAESSSNFLRLDASQLTVGVNRFYVRLRTSESCYTAATAIDSIDITKSATTAIIDVDFPGSKIYVYPMPFTRTFYIKGLQVSKSYSISLINSMGQTIYQRKVQHSSELNISNDGSSGNYWLSIYDETKKKLLGVIAVVKK